MQVRYKQFELLPSTAIFIAGSPEVTEQLVLGPSIEYAVGGRDEKEIE